MSLDIASRLFDVELRQRRIIGTGAGNHHMVDRGRQLVEELPQAIEVGGAQRVELARGALEALGISAGEDQLDPFTACSSGRFEPDAGGAADYDDGLAEEFRFALDGRGAGSGAHDSSDQESKIAFALLWFSASRCVTVEDEVASFGGLVAGKAGFVHCLVRRFAVVKLSEPPATGGSVFS